MNETHVGLTAGGGGAILHGHEDSRISGDGGIVDDCTSRVVKGLDGEICEVAPMLIEAILPVEDKSIDDGRAIELRAKSVEDETCVHRERLQSFTSDLKCVSALVDRHGGLDLGVHSGRVAANLNCHQIPRDESHFPKRRRGWSSGHGEKRGSEDLSNGAPLKEGSQWTSCESQETIGELKPTGGNRKIVSFRVMYLSKASK